ncbi:Hypothetical protein PHPALM_16574 [Phytophthora palmivora]|uniref:Uncharacterized protein n=1 Tax=Phytophthora palmivora TaxID=4796 RepID=A0A2P4XPF2_9STRA|nr:Hypothetical protein PHPALM_16574 [Phytophthora palmivora]
MGSSVDSGSEAGDTEELPTSDDEATAADAAVPTPAPDVVDLTSKTAHADASQPASSPFSSPLVTPPPRIQALVTENAGLQRANSILRQHSANHGLNTDALILASAGITADDIDWSLLGLSPPRVTVEPPQTSSSGRSDSISSDDEASDTTQQAISTPPSTSGNVEDESEALAHLQSAVVSASILHLRPSLVRLLQ